MFTVLPSVSGRAHTAGSAAVDARATIHTEAGWIGENGEQGLKCDSHTKISALLQYTHTSGGSGGVTYVVVKW